MTGHDDDFFNWSGESVPDQGLLTDYQRQLHIRYDPLLTEHCPRGDPFAVLGVLRLLPEDKAYLHGFMGALQLPEHVQHGLLVEYRQRWERAEQRANNPNQAINNGRRAANVWIQQGAKGFIHWVEVSAKPP